MGTKQVRKMPVDLVALICVMVVVALLFAAALNGWIVPLR